MNFFTDSCGLSDIGLVRANNEDAYLVSKEINFYALADGMGGHLAGEIASKLFIQIAEKKFKEYFSSEDRSVSSVSEDELLLNLNNLFVEANQVVWNQAQMNHSHKGMGTTACCCFVSDSKLFYGHVGDSRIYLFRKHLTQVTTDHSLRQELIDKGCLTMEAARKFPYRNVITKAIGKGADIDAEIDIIPIAQGDLVLLCSDGLSDSLNDREIEEILKHKKPTSELASDLILAAKSKGGQDNVTVVLVRIS